MSTPPSERLASWRFLNLKGTKAVFRAQVEARTSQATVCHCSYPGCGKELNSGPIWFIRFSENQKKGGDLPWVNILTLCACPQHSTQIAEFFAQLIEALNSMQSLSPNNTLVVYLGGIPIVDFVRQRLPAGLQVTAVGQTPGPSA